MQQPRNAHRDQEENGDDQVADHRHDGVEQPDHDEAAKGKVKKGVGKALDDPYLEGEGKADQVKGNLKQAGEKVKDAAKK
jgi:uncharacterized protein YjbJ (UPF0337 family)